MSEYGVLCTMADGEKAILTTEAGSAQEAEAQVRRHKALFYGPGDGAGRWLAARQPHTTVTVVHEAKPLEEWDR